MAKALLIKSSAGSKEAIQGQWQPFEQSTPYIQGIETGDLLDNITAEVLNSTISGLPNVWSRARAFGYAFKYTQSDANIQTSGLIGFYKILLAEWKGLLALMALFPDRVSLSEPVSLNPKEREPLFNIPNSFGRLLFEDIDLWCEPELLRAQKQEKPFLQLIYYNNELVGATSPYSLVFTGIDYSRLPAGNGLTWFRDGRLQDPLEIGNLSNDQLQKLYLLIKNLLDKIPPYEKSINANRSGRPEHDLKSLFNFLRQWASEIKAKGHNITEEGALDSELKFAQPYEPLFRVKQELFHQNGVFSYQGNGEPVDIQQLMLQDSFIYGFQELDPRSPLDKSAVQYLKALDPQDSKKHWYFPLPLSTYALKIFKNRVGELVGHSEEYHQLQASFSNFKLTVSLYLRVDGKRQTPIVKQYEVKLLTGAQRNVVMWPNFISRDWNSYYLYSEYPSNSTEVKLVPFYRDYVEGTGYNGGYISNEQGEIVYGEERAYNSDLEVQRLVKYPVEIATSDDHPYEIFRANKPFAGMEIRSRINGVDRVCGYLMMKKPNDDSMGDNKMPDLSHETNFDQAVVGIDFGSNNSCVSYSKVGDNEAMPIRFENRRVFLLGSEVFDPDKSQLAVRNELLFFQNESSANGQVKSWVHDHEPRYVPQGMGSEALAGGVPIFEPNLIIHKMDERTITTNAGTLHHSMKWLTDNKGKETKTAYLKTLWVMVAADLYAKRMMPAELRWSYPGSFSQLDVNQYQLMYGELRELPIAGRGVEVSYQPSTEAEAVCNYAMTKTMPDDKSILLGIDVGGSTSDVLVVGNLASKMAYSMTKQSSLRMAAGLFSQVVRRFAESRQAILSYHASPRCRIKVANIDQITKKPETAPFYLNAILDRLEDKDFHDFYAAMGKSVPGLFAIPAYLTGVLLFYSGQLIAKTAQEHPQDLGSIRTVTFMPFGKGGRVFDWLDVFPGKHLSEKYYNDCFRAGFGQGGQNITLRKKDDVRKDNKSEVAKGLSAPQRVMPDADLRENSDIFGEEGFTFRRQGQEPLALKPDDVIRPDHLAEMNFGISFPDQFVRFEEFLKIFLDFVGPVKSGIVRNTATLQKQVPSLRDQLKSFILNDPEWLKANKESQEGQPFSFKHSMFVLEAMCFLEKAIIPELYKG